MQGARYRSIPEFVNTMVTEATFVGTPGSTADIESRMEASRAKRKATQPQEPSAGCTFVNPEQIPAGKLIDELGLKGTRIGGAMISPVHANFIINTGGAKATDVTELIDLIRARVRNERGIDLKTEVQVVGDRETRF